jgi:hypothetical protein
MKIRLAAPRNLKVQSYELQFEAKQSDGSWRVLTNVPVTAVEVEGPLGYTGWGWHQPGTGLQMTATNGAYRLRARAVRPAQGEYGEWQEFTIAGVPGPGPDVVPKTNVLQGLGRTSMAAEPATTSTLAPLPKSTSTLDWSKAAR